VLEIGWQKKDYGNNLTSSHVGVVPASSRITFRFRRIGGAYIRSTGLHATVCPTARFNIFRCIMVPIVNCITLRTGPGAHPPSQLFPNVTASRTSLTARIKAINLMKDTPIPFGLIFQLINQLAPAHIYNMFTQIPIRDHILDRQILSIDRLVFANQPSAQLMQMIQTRAGNFVMYLCSLQASLFSILRSYLFATQETLCSSQSPLVPCSIFRIRDFLSFGSCQRIGQPYVNANLFGCGLHILSWFINLKTYEIMSSSSTRYGNHRWVGPESSRPFNFQFSHLSQSQGASFHIPRKGHLSIGSRLPLDFFLKLRVMCSFFPKIDICRLQVSQGLLQGYATNLLQPASLRLLFQDSKHSVGLRMADGFFSFIPSLLSNMQEVIKNISYGAKCFRQMFLLFWSRITPVFEGLDRHLLQITPPSCQSKGLSK
jgi:hypothetical protein